MGYYSNFLIIKSIDWLCGKVADLFRYIFADKEKMEYIKKVPHFCRVECDKVFECRNPNNDYKTFYGCLYWTPPQDTSNKKKKKVKYHKNGLPIETRYNEEDYKYFR